MTVTSSSPSPSSFRRRAFLSGVAGTGILAGLPLHHARANQTDEIEIVSPWDIKSVVPRDSGQLFMRPGITETLTVVEPDGTIVPFLAKALTTSEDARVWRIELRRDVKFHDGTPADAEAIVAALRRLAPLSQYVSTAGITSIEAVGDAIVLTTVRPFPSMPVYLSDPTLPILAPASFDAKGEVVRIVATGPFKIHTMDLPRSLNLARHDNHWGSPTQAARVYYQTVPNGETRANMAMAGDADVIFNIPNPSVARVSARGRVEVARVIIPRVHILMPNVALPQFADARVRHALSMAIDRGGIASTIMRNPALAATSYLPHILKDWHQPDLPPLSFDVARANRLLDEAGWARGGEGIRAKDGKRFSGTVRTFANRPELPVIATTLQAQFRAIGFDLTIKVGEFTEIVEAQKDGSLELGLSSRNLVIVPDPIGTIGADFSGGVSPGGAVGATNWNSQPMRDAIDGYMTTVDPQKLARSRRQIVAILQTELPVIPIVWYDQIVAIRKGVDGFANDPFEQRYFVDRLRRRS